MALNMLGLDVAVITKVSKDQRSSLVGELERAGVNVRCHDSHQTTVFENIYSKRDRDSRVQKVKSVASPFSSEDIVETSASIFHIGPLTNEDVPAALLRETALKDCTVSLDVQGFLRKTTRGKVIAVDWQDKARGLAYVDILKADQKEARILTGENHPERAALKLSEFGPQEVIITLGSRGSCILAHGEFYQIPASPVREVVDATGCGDTYMAGYLYKRLESHDFFKAGTLAAHLAALKLEAFGALRTNRQPFPSPHL